jgi:hypothetical protein
VSVLVVSQVFRYSRSRFGTRLVLLALADAAWNDGITWATEERLAAQARVSVRQVRRCIRTLEELEELSVGKVRVGRSTRNVYRVIMPELHEIDFDRIPFQLHPDIFTGSTAAEAEDSPGQIVAVHPDKSDRSGRVLPYRSNRKRTVSPPGDELALAGADPMAVKETAQTLTGFFVDESKARGTSPARRTIGTVAKYVKELLDEGQPPEAVKAGILRMLDRRVVQPAMLGQFVQEAALPARRNSGKPTTRDMLAAADRLRREGK